MIIGELYPGGKMKSFMPSLSAVMFATFFLFCSAQSFFQTSTGVQHAISFEQASDPDHELAENNKRYKLDSSQRDEIKPILESQAKDLKIIAGDSALSPEQRGEKSQDVRRVCSREIEAVLHDRQRMLFDHDQK
jgi:hypothetical protein